MEALILIFAIFFLGLPFFTLTWALLDWFVEKRKKEAARREAIEAADRRRQYHAWLASGATDPKTNW